MKKNWAATFLISSLLFNQTIPLIAYGTEKEDSQVIMDEQEEQQTEGQLDQQIEKTEESVLDEINPLVIEEITDEDNNALETKEQEEQERESEVVPIEESSHNSAQDMEQSKEIMQNVQEINKEEAQPKELFSGTLGTSKWSVTEEGTLVIGAGVWPNKGEGWVIGAGNPFLGGNNINSAKVKHIIFEGKVQAGNSLARLFEGMRNVTSIENLDFLDTSQVTNMGSAFAEMDRLTSLDVTSFDTSKVTDMSFMFGKSSGATSLVNVDVSKLDTSQVTTMRSMFANNSNLKNLDVSHFNTNKVTTMESMFMNVSRVTSLDLANFNTNQVTNMSSMFDGMSRLTQLNVSSFNTDKVTNMSNMFRGMFTLSNLDIDSFTTNRVTNMSAMFSGMASLKNLDSTTFDTSNVKNMSMMFSDMTSLISLDISHFNTKQVTNMSFMFRGMTLLKELNIRNFDTSQVTNMNSMFYDMSNLTSLSLESFDTSKVTNMNSFLSRAFKLQHLKLGKLLKFTAESDFVLSDITNVAPYTGKWYKDPGDSTRRFTSKELVSNYNGTTMSGDYYWFGVTIEAKNSTVYKNDVWNPKDNFVLAKDLRGNTIDFNTVKIIGNVNTEVVGAYQITYDIEGIVKTITVHVKENLSSMKTEDSTIYVGDNWSPEDNFVSAIDKEGIPVDFNQVTIEGEVDVTLPGIYEVTYSYSGVSQKVQVTVLANQTSLSAKNLTIYEGDIWTAEDNFISATDKDGNSLDFSFVQVEENVDPLNPGNYKVTYTIEGIKKMVTVTVLKNYTALEAKDSTIKVGDLWTAQDNFIFARDKNNTIVEFESIQVEGRVDTTVPGKYKIAYRYDGLVKEITVTVSGLTEMTGNETNQSNTPFPSDVQHNEENLNQGNHFPKTGEQSHTLNLLVGLILVIFSFIGIRVKK